MFLFNTLVALTLVIASGWTRVIDASDVSRVEKWKLGWRLINSSWDKNYPLGEQQFDSLLETKGPIELKFLITGLDILAELGKTKKIQDVLSKQNQETLDEICNNELFTTKLRDIRICKSHAKKEQIGNRALQMELIKMYISDQSARGNIPREIITKYKLDDFQLTDLDGVTVDRINREKLKEIISEFGFPTKQLVGRDAMQCVFLIIQHADADAKWQKEQLPNIESAVKNGDVEGERFAYLYDRVRVNGGEKQLYGTQFKNVDPIHKRVELAETDDVENLDLRRMEFGMMPIQMYKQFMLRSLQGGKD